MSDLYHALRDKIHEIEEDVQKFYDKGNKAAGTRIRKAMQEVKGLAQDIRNDVQAKKSG